MTSNNNKIVICIVAVVVLTLFGSIYLSKTCLQMANPILTMVSSEHDEATTVDKNNEKNSSPRKKRKPPPSRQQHHYPDEAQLHQSIRKPNSESYLDPLPSSCDHRYGNRQCNFSSSSSSSSFDSDALNNASHCCCCCWRPHPMSCVGHFKNASAVFIKSQLEKVGFFKQGTHLEACPWYDRGTWHKPLPRNFLDMDYEEAEHFVTSEETGCPCEGRRTTTRSKRTRGNNIIKNGRKSAIDNSDNNKKHNNTNNNKNIGLMYLHELATTTKRLRSVPNFSPLSSTDKGGTEHATQSPPSSDSSFASRGTQRITTKNAPGGILTFAGDSMTRQLFSRMVHRIRSRECSAEAEMRRAAVFELQIHDTAVYVATNLGDAFVLAKTCEAGLDFLTSTLTRSAAATVGETAKTTSTATSSTSSSLTNVSSPESIGGTRRSPPAPPPPHIILFQACFIWDNTPSGLLGTVANLHQLKDRVAALVIFPQIWFCGTHAEIFCMNANQSNGATLTAIGTAVHYGVPRIVVTTNVIRHHFDFFQLERVRKRNRQLEAIFPHQPFVKEHPWIRSMGENEEQGEGIAMTAKQEETSEESARREGGGQRTNSTKSATSPPLLLLRPSSSSSQQRSGHVPRPNPNDVSNEFIWPNVRLYDFATRHDSLAPEQCDVVHGMCMFLPARHAHVSAAVRSLFGGSACPSAGYGKCQDMGNFKLLDEIMTTIKV